MARTKFGTHRTLEDPRFVHNLFSNTRLAWVWAVLRIWLGLQWLNAGFHKVTDPSWVGSGEALKSFWSRIVQVPEGGRPAITYGWYREFIQGMLEGGHYAWFAPLVAWGELLLGVLLILGLLTGFAAFLGAFANMSFMLAGTASTNPVLYTVAILLVLAWKVAGHWGLDYWVLPALGTPWRQSSAGDRRTV